ncbi:MAG: hypothetical protein ACRYG8_13220 [Janthinobacterium lividum]
MEDMDLTIATQITDALSNGAIAAASGVATSLVTDAYGGLKALVVGRFKRPATIDALEEDPSSDTQKAAVAEALSKSGAADDPEVQDLARQLAAALAGMDALNAGAMGLDIEDLQAASVRLVDIVSQGTAVRIRRTTVTGTFEAEGIRSGQGATEKN